LLKNELSTLAAISTDVDTSNRSDEVGKYDHDINAVTPNTDKYNSKDRASDPVACLVEDPNLSESNDGAIKFDCSAGDQVQELVRVKLQVAALHNQVASLNRVVDSMNVVVEFLSKVVIPNEGSNLHSELRLETMLTEFSNILESKNKVISLLAEVSICAGNSKEKRPLPRSDSSKVHDRGRVKPVCKTSSETGLEK
jgi:hypothetical protein